jgi:hypothetical protein
MLTTFADLIDHALAYLGGDTNRANSDKARRAVIQAYTELPTKHQWNFFRSVGRVTTYASYATGTVTYDHTGGANERQVTLTGGTFPSYAAGATLVIADIPYTVDERISSTVLTLTAGSNPGEDITDATAFTIYQDSYALPSDFLVADEFVCDQFPDRMMFRPAHEWATYRRRNVGPGKPISFTFTGDGLPAGSMVVRFFPPPDIAYAMDFLYKRRARRLAIDRREDGTVSVTSSGTTVTGANTNFTASMVGSVIRIGGNSVNPVTGYDGEFPPEQERTIDDVASATSLTVTAAFDQTLAGMRYVVSDPVDYEPDIMGRFLLREVERQCRLMARMKALPDDAAEHMAALIDARAADSRYSGRRAEGNEGIRGWRLRDYPTTGSGTEVT